MVWGEPIAMITVTPIITTAMTDGIMSTKQPLLTALQWLSPAFPIGSFAYSHGLEWAIEAGHINDEPTLQNWLQDLIALGSGRSDAILVSLAYCAEDRPALKSLNDLALAFAPSSERRAETVLQGQAFCQTLRDVWDYTYPASAVRLRWAMEPVAVDLRERILRQPICMLLSPI